MPRPAGAAFRFVSQRIRAAAGDAGTRTGPAHDTCAIRRRGGMAPPEHAAQADRRGYAGAAEVKADATDGVRIRVLGRGPGIPEAERGKVMEPFYRVETSRSRDTGGTGLGLAIAQQLAASIGATLILRNRAGGGLEASLHLRSAGPGATG